MKKHANNLITNFTTLAQECDEFNVNVASFIQADLEDYPKQNNLCDCGFFGLKYVENLDGKAMQEFEQEDMTRYRMEVTYSLYNHPLNNAPKSVHSRKSWRIDFSMVKDERALSLGLVHVSDGSILIG